MALVDVQDARTASICGQVLGERVGPGRWIRAGPATWVRPVVVGELEGVATCIEEAGLAVQLLLQLHGLAELVTALRGSERARRVREGWRRTTRTVDASQVWVLGTLRLEESIASVDPLRAELRLALRRAESDRAS